MHTFLDWVKEQKLDLPSFNDGKVADKVETDAKPTIDEKRVRTGYSANYPPAYVSSQYPHKYFNPAKATADLDKQNMDKKDIVTPWFN